MLVQVILGQKYQRNLINQKRPTIRLKTRNDPDLSLATQSDPVASQIFVKYRVAFMSTLLLVPVSTKMWV